MRGARSFVLCWPLAVLAQAPAPAGEARQRLDLYIGEWSVAGDTDPPEVCTWFDERPSVVVCRSEHRPATGPPVRGVSLLGYDESTQRYTYYHYNNRGLTRSQIGWWVDGEFRFVGERLIGGRAVREQVRIRRSDKGMTFEEQRSVEGGPWTPRASFEYLRLR